MTAQRYLHTYGLGPEVFGHVAVVDRLHAARNPVAYFHGKPITLADHAASRWIVEPLRLLDCCQETDGGQALVVTGVERARDLPRPPAVVVPAAQGAGWSQEQMTSYYRDGLNGLPETAVVARQLWRGSGLSPADIDVGILYDHFTPFVLMQLEKSGFCRPGGRLRRGGRPAPEHPWGPAGGGVPPWDERHRGGPPADPRHLGEPGGGRGKVPGHGRYGRSGVGPGPRYGRLSGTFRVRAAPRGARGRTLTEGGKARPPSGGAGWTPPTT